MDKYESIIKKCNKCGIEKELSLFIKNKKCKNGYGGTCKECSNKYSKKWKQINSTELSQKRRFEYAQNEGVISKQREIERRKNYPLRTRCQILRSGMMDRSKTKKIDFDKDFFTVKYLMNRLTENPYCECCHTKLDIGFKEDGQKNDSSPSMDRVDSNRGYTKDNVAILCWRCNKHKQDSNSQELRMLADFIDKWNNVALR